MSKLDVKDRFWRVVTGEGSEWNFSYVFPDEPGQPIRLVVPTSIQMGWSKSPSYFCAATETARDIADDYVRQELGTLLHQKFEERTLPSAKEMKSMVDSAGAASYNNAYATSGIVLDQTQWTTDQVGTFLSLIDVFVDDFINLAKKRA